MKTIAFLLVCVLGAVLASSSEEIDSSEFGVQEITGTKKTNCTCGLANKGSKRIVGGKETEINEFPFMIGLMSARFKIVICGATILTPRHALTAAHCTHPMKMANTKMAIVVGEHDTIKRLETDATQIINVNYSIEHEEYGTFVHQNDIAILVLEEKITFNDKVGPVCLPTQKTDISGRYITVIGWGRLSFEGSSSTTLMKVNLKVMNVTECNGKIPLKLQDVHRQFCTYGKARKDSCKGDSGGPLVMVDPETNRYVQHGIVSMGFNGCATKNPSVNTNVANYLDWIQRKIRESEQTARTCSKI